MWRFIKKWWLLKNLRKAIALHTQQQPIEKLSGGGKVLLTQDFFIKGSDAYPGLAKKSINRFSWLFCWRKKENAEKLKKRIHEYNEIFEVCAKEGYVEIDMTSGGPMPSVATEKAAGISGWFGLLQKLLKDYYLAWILIVIPLLSGIYGSEYLKYLIKGLAMKLGLISQN